MHKNNIIEIVIMLSVALKNDNDEITLNIASSLQIYLPSSLANAESAKKNKKKVKKASIHNVICHDDQLYGIISALTIF